MCGKARDGTEGCSDNTTCLMGRCFLPTAIEASREAGGGHTTQALAR